MSFIAYCGFIHDLPTTLVGDGAEVDTTVKHDGNPSLKITYDGTNAAYFKMLDMHDGAVTDMYYTTVVASGYFRFATEAACEVLQLTAYDTEALVASLRLTAAAKLALYNSAGTAAATGTTTLAINTWYFVQLTVNVAADGAYALSIDLTEEFTGTSNFATTEVGDIRFGVTTPTGSSAMTFYWANVSANDTEELATGQRIIQGYVDGNGTWTEWDGDCTDVDDDPSDDDTTKITTSTAGARETVALDYESMADDTTVYSLMGRTISKCATGTLSHRTIIYSDGTDGQSGLTTVSTSWTQGAKIDDTDPATAAAWTLAGALAAEVGIRKSTGGETVSSCTCIWSELLIAADDYVIPYESGATAIAFMSDLHCTVDAPFIAMPKKCLQWIQMHGMTPEALFVAGDLTENDEGTEIPFSDWINDSDGGNLSAEIDLILAPGNWDSNQLPFGYEYGAIEEDPFSGFRGVYSDLYTSTDYGYWDSGSVVRVAYFNNIADYVTDEGASAYYNCNPPGEEEEENPDQSGIVTAGSDLREWLDYVFTPTSPRWRIFMAHRSFWAPYDSDPRKLLRDGRAALARGIRYGVSIVFTGDIHVGSLSGPWYPDETYVAPGGAGAYSLTLAGGYVLRQVDETVLPSHATTCAWSSGGATASKIAQAAIIVFDNDGDTAAITIYEASQADPRGSVVYTGTLTRNQAGGPMSAIYATAELIRGTHEEFSRTDSDSEYVYSDATLLGWAENYTEPIVNARLKSAGFSTPITDPTDEDLFFPIRLAASYLAGAHGLRHNARHRITEGDGVAGMLQEIGQKILEDVASGRLDVGETRTTYGQAVINATTDTRPDEATFVSADETAWSRPTESRLSD